MAPVLASHGTMSRYAMLTLMEQAGVGSIPEPNWAPVIAPAKYIPGVKAVAAVRRPSAPPSSRPVSGRPYTLEAEGVRQSDPPRPITQRITLVDYHDYYPQERGGYTYMRLEHKRDRSERFFVLGKAEGWECSSAEGAIAQLETVAPF